MDENRERVLRALSRIGAGAKHFAGLPFSLQLPAVAAVLLALSTFAPLYGDGPFPGQSWVAELDYNFGLLTLLVAIGCIALMVRLIRRQMTTDPGGLAALGLLAVITVGVEAIRIHDAPPPQSAGASM